MQQELNFKIDRERYDHKNEERITLRAKPGLNEEVIRLISKTKKEPEWMLQKRLKALEIFNKLKMPDWGPDITELVNNLNKITFFLTPDAKRNAKKWEDLPEDIRKTFERLGIPEAERTALAGAGATYESNSIYHNLKKEWEDKGVIFIDMDEAVQKYPELVKKYFMTSCVSPSLHKFAALHAAVWSSGTFLFVPENVKVDVPMQAYFRMNAEKMGQFEHTLIIVEKNSQVSYIEGCSSPIYEESSLHAGCVEVHVKENARARYTSIENWSKNTYNLNTKRAVVDENGIIEWINCNSGCLTGDSKIFTNPKGPVDIKSIKKGDKVYVFDEATNSIKKSMVKAKIFSGLKKVYRLNVAGRNIEASANHPFLTLMRRKNKPEHKKGFFHREWIPLEDLKEGDLVAITKRLPIVGEPYILPRIKRGGNILSKNQFSNFEMNTLHLYNKNLEIPEKTDDDFMWVMGILLGDGYIDLKRNKITIATHEREDYRDHLIEIIKKLFNYKVIGKEERYIVVNSRVLCQLFYKIGFAGTANTKRIPKWAYKLPESQILALLAGYFDSDGHPADGLAFTSINKKLLEDIKCLGIQMGFGFSNIFKHGDGGERYILGNKCRTQDSWRILFNGKRIKDLPIRCKAKKAKADKIKTKRNYVSANGLNFKSKVNDEIGFARINKIGYIGVKPTYDIEVVGCHNFIANGLIVHNSCVTMLYPTSILRGKNAKSDFIGIALAGKGQNQDTGTKVYHLAPNTKSTVKSKSISMDGGITTYRGLLKIDKRAVNAKSNVRCDALMMDEISKSNTVPYMEIDQDKAEIGHEATVGKISDEQIFYLMSRGLSEEQAMQMVVSGFIEPVVKELPIEYAVEFNRLVQLEIEESLG